jgi:hypothetical protein
MFDCSAAESRTPGRDGRAEFLSSAAHQHAGNHSPVSSHLPLAAASEDVDICFQAAPAPQVAAFTAKAGAIGIAEADR